MRPFRLHSDFVQRSRRTQRDCIVLVIRAADLAETCKQSQRQAAFFPCKHLLIKHLTLHASHAFHKSSEIDAVPLKGMVRSGPPVSVGCNVHSLTHVLSNAAKKITDDSSHYVEARKVPALKANHVTHASSVSFCRVVLFLLNIAAFFYLRALPPPVWSEALLPCSRRPFRATSRSIRFACGPRRGAQSMQSDRLAVRASCVFF